MDISHFKSKGVVETAQMSQGGNKSGGDSGLMSSSFGELLKSTGKLLGNGLNIMAEQASMNRVAADDASARKQDDNHREPKEKSVDKSRDRDDRSSDDRGERRVDKADNKRDDKQVTARDDHRPADKDTQTSADKSDHVDNRDQKTAGSGNQDNSTDKEQQSSAQGEDHANSAGQDQSAADNSGSDQKGQALTGKAVSAAAQSGDGSDVAEQVLAALVASNPTQAADGLSKAAATDRPVAVEGVDAKANGPAVTVPGAEQQAKGQAAGNNGDQNAMKQSLHNMQQQQQAGQQAQNNGNGQGAFDAALQNAAKPEQNQQQNASSTKTQQAAGIAKAIGEGNDVKVNVNVADEKSTLVSKPQATLTNTTPTAADQVGQTLRAQQGQQGPQVGLAQAQNQAAQQAQGNIGQGVGSGDAAKVAATAGTDAKPGPLAQTQAGSTVQTGGSETTNTAASNAQNQTAQAQQAANAQKAQGHHKAFNIPRQAVVDQVSVQISRALANGLDKINIHLKPGGLGRVDVQMEMAHDGRVTAVVTADNKDTLDLLKQDSRELEKALQEAGLTADQDSLEFNLREQTGEGQNGDDRGSGKVATGEGVEEAIETNQHIPLNIITDSRVDVSA